MSKIRKSELKKEYVNNVLFKDKEKLRLLKLFINIDGSILIEIYDINKDGTISEMRKQVANKKSYFHSTSKKDDNHSLLNYKVLDNGYVTFYLSSINTTKEGDEKIIKTLSSNLSINNQFYWGYALFNESYPPIVVLDVDSSIIEKNPIDVVVNDDCLLNSLYCDINIKTETRVIERSSCKCSPILSSFESAYIRSSYTKEDIKYNDEGEVIYYRNDTNKVKYIEDEEGYRLTFVNGILVRLVFMDNNIMVTEEMGIQTVRYLNDQKSSIVCDGRRTAYYFDGELEKTEKESSYIYKPELKRPIIDFNDKPIDGEYYQYYYYDNDKIFAAYINYNKCLIFYDNGMPLINSTPASFNSASHVAACYHNNLDNENIVYTDNDIEISFDNSMQVISYKHKFYNKLRYLYLRDIRYGIPFKHVDLEEN